MRGWRPHFKMCGFSMEASTLAWIAIDSSWK
jgi:hypothetical protein